MTGRDPTPFTFRACQIFVAAVEAGSVTRAAQRLGLSPSSVSQQLANLEAALGAQLLERSARRFRLTSSGRLFLARARQLLDDVSAAKAELTAENQSPAMRLRLAVVEEFDAEVTADWLARLARRYPNIAVTVTSGASHANHDALESRAADMVIAVDAAEPSEAVEAHPLLRDRFLAVMAPALPERPGREALLARPFLRYARELYIGRSIEAHLGRAGLRPGPGHAFTTNRALFAMVAATGGWGVSTALAVLGTPGAEALVRAEPLPVPGFSRRLGLHVRRGALGVLPAQFAAELRASLAARLLPRAAAELAFLPGALELTASLEGPSAES